MRKLALLATGLLALVSCGSVPAPATTPAQSTGGSLSEQVIYGTNSSIAAHPYQVAISYNGTHWCGGTLIASDWVLTAAHCVVGKSASSFKVRAGSTYNNSGGQVVGVNYFRYHSSYRDVTTGYDVAVMKLSAPITISSAALAVVPGSTADATATALGRSLVISGWGRTDPYSGYSPTNLREATLPIVSASTCASQNGIYSMPGGTVCGGVNYQGQSGCNGDSGGPFAAKGANGKWYVFGIVSWGPVPYCNTAATVFTRTASFGSWIQQQTGVVPQN